ncbi:hypothetical protein PR048_013470 [Dryococelus australis]|uniref:Integrase zinc-binding domain-containing protein n=1 Tax=Dryococelus australis TaxID=614101 RepID=A0ABQ9HSJ3_9NEOP|nr:hypothetical protein PR048_013470 [Dryococelus australis]
MMHQIKKCTEQEVCFVLKDDNWMASFEELEAFIGILNVRGAYGANTIHLLQLWSFEWDYKFCLLSEIWKKFVNNCFICYNRRDSITIDEQLFPSKCRQFTQYMPNKPDKFGEV